MIKSLAVIYRILNGATNEDYIGSTGNFVLRFKGHKDLLKSNKHYNENLQKAWNNYGEEVFDFLIIEYIEDETLLLARETYWINKLQPKYNVNMHLYKHKRVRMTKDEVKKFLKGNKLGAKLEKWPHGYTCKCKDCRKKKNELAKNYKLKREGKLK